MGVIEKLTGTRKKATTGAGDAKRALSELRALSSRLRDQRAEIETRPVPLEEAQNAAAVAILHEAEKIISDVSLASLARPADGRQPSLALSAEARSALAFAAVAPEIGALIGARLAARYRAAGLTGISDDDRVAELARLDADALAAELAEEAIVRSLEKDGMAVLRRPDADPRATLADDRELR